MRRTLIVLALLTSGCAEPAPPLPPPPGVAIDANDVAPNTPPAAPKDFRLTLHREEDGSWIFLRCTLDLLVMAGPAPVTLTCEGRDGVELSARSEMAAAEVEDLRGALERAAIYDPPHTGLDRGLVHWRFETVSVRSLGTSAHDRAVVLVASGNESFKSGPRAELLQSLRRLQEALEGRLQ